MLAKLPACALQSLVRAPQMRWQGGLLSCLLVSCRVCCRRLRYAGRDACCGGQAACLCPA